MLEYNGYTARVISIMERGMEMVVVEQDHLQERFKRELPAASIRFLAYSQENEASEWIDRFISESFSDCFILFRAMGLPGDMDDMLSVFDHDRIYFQGDAKKVFMKRFPVFICRIGAGEIRKALMFWSSSVMERRFIYCVHKDSLDSVLAYLTENAYSDQSGCLPLWEQVECVIENVPEFEYVDSYVVTMKTGYAEKLEVLSYPLDNS